MTIKTMMMAVLFLVFSMPSSVWGQDIFNQSSDADVAAGIAVKLPEIEFGRQNDFFSTLLMLQKQNALIGKLINREKEISQITKYYNTMGLDFNAPPPNRDLCEQIPANKVCHFYYKGMYKNYSPTIGETKTALAQPVGKKNTPLLMPPVLNIPKQLSEQTDEEKTQLKTSKFAWSDITCRQDECRAVIMPYNLMLTEEGNTVKSYQNKLRYTVRAGDELPSGGVIDAISSAGVFIKVKGNVSPLEPAPVVLAREN